MSRQNGDCFSASSSTGSEKLASTVIQLVQVPVFLHFWGTPLFGEWLILNSVPAYLSFSSIGFGNIAGNEMTMMAARNDREDALRVFQSCWWLITLICSTVLTLLGGALYFLPAARFLRLTHISESDTKWIIFYLGISVLFGQLEQLLQSAYRCIGRYPYGTAMKTAFSFLAFSSMIVAVALGAGPRNTARVFAIINIASTITLCLFVRHDIPWIKFGWKYASLSEIRRLTPLAVAFMGFPAGNALNLQGTLLAVGYALGPVAVVIFGTARTVSRVALQMVQMINTTFEPELSIAYGTRNFELTRTLLRRACQLALAGRYRHRSCHDALWPMVSDPLDGRTRAAQPTAAEHSSSGRCLICAVVYERQPDYLNEPSSAIGNLVCPRDWHDLHRLLLFCPCLGSVWSCSLSSDLRNGDEPLRRPGLAPDRS